MLLTFPVVAAVLTSKEAVELVQRMVRKNKTLAIRTSFAILGLFFQPHYLFMLDVKVKRGFGLGPRLLTLYFWVNALTGEVLRTKDLPELTDSDVALDAYQGPLLTKNEAETIAHRAALDYSIRWYRTFWLPDVSTKEWQIVLLPYYLVECTRSDGKILLEVNAFSGGIRTVKGDKVSPDLTEKHS